MNKFPLIFFLLLPFLGLAQTNSSTCKILGSTEPFALIIVEATDINTTSDIDGEFAIEGLDPGIYNVVVSALGFQKKVLYDVETTPSRPAYLNIDLEPLVFTTGEAEVVTSANTNAEESPLSVRSIGANEIKRNPGGGRDISRALRALPGVVSIPTFRNDLVIRGGAPGENKFFIDGIEIPTINHFSTQGSSGGAVGMINVDLVENVELNTGAFPTNRMNALSSVLDFQFKTPRNDKWTTNAVVGTSDLGITLEGPTGENSSLALNSRRSYLQALFRLLELPFLPIYNDLQYKWVYTPNDNTRLTLLGIGAIDDFEINTDLGNEPGASAAILDYLEIQKQWNYTQGVRLDKFGTKGVWSIIASRNHLNNRAFKHLNNDESLPITRNYKSEEIENKLRVERKKFGEVIQLGSGFNIDFSKHSVESFNPIDTLDSGISVTKLGGYWQASSKILEDRVTLSGGVRADGALLPKRAILSFSPRFSASYAFAPEWTFNANAGIYNQLPSLTILGYSEENWGSAKYTSSKQIVAGIRKEFPTTNTSISFEAFNKRYSNAPMSLTNGVALANMGADFGVIGNEAVSFDAEGHAYGTELFLQQKLHKGMYGLLSYTWFRSLYTDDSGEWIRSSWDSRHVVSLTGGKKFKNGLEIGARFVFSGGLPYTPNLESSYSAESWAIFGRPLPNYSAINSEQLNSYHQLDIRVDKRFFFEKWTMDVFFEVQNAYGSQIPTPPQIDVVRDSFGSPVDSDGDGIYETVELESNNAAILPAFGLIIEL